MTWQEDQLPDWAKLERTKAQAEIERLRGRSDATHELITTMFWDGAIDQEDANKLHAQLRGDT